MHLNVSHYLERPNQRIRARIQRILHFSDENFNEDENFEILYLMITNHEKMQDPAIREQIIYILKDEGVYNDYMVRYLFCIPE